MSGSSDCNLLWWVIPGALAGMPMPFIHLDRRMNPGSPLTASTDDLPALHAAGVRAVVCLLNIPTDARVYESAGFVFLCLPIPDGGAPTMEQTSEFVRFVRGQRAADHPVAVHCEAGIGRTGTMLAVYLISEGSSAEAAIRRIRGAEPAAVETPRQIQFLEYYERQTNVVKPTGAPGIMRTLAIGDIHGCATALTQLLREVAPTENDRIVFTGDYIDNGPDTRQVID
jgi:atypical dual specificity phosphatase